MPCIPWPIPMASNPMTTDPIQNTINYIQAQIERLEQRLSEADFIEQDIIRLEINVHRKDLSFILEQQRSCRK